MHKAVKVFDVPVLKIKWNLKIDNNSNPAQGIFSLKVNEVEKSCNAVTSGPLNNISLLAEDNGAILVMSCDKSFYMQLYITGGDHLFGSYFEKQQDSKYKSRGYVMLTRDYMPK